MTEDRGDNPPEADLQERRQGRRFIVSWPTRIAGDDAEGIRFDEDASLKNLSSGGAYFLLPRQVVLGARLDVSVRVPFKGESWMRYSGEVIRVDLSTEGRGVAMRFDGFRPAFGGG